MKVAILKGEAWLKKADLEVLGAGRRTPYMSLLQGVAPRGFPYLTPVAETLPTAGDAQSRTSAPGIQQSFDKCRLGMAPPRRASERLSSCAKGDGLNSCKLIKLPISYSEQA